MFGDKYIHQFTREEQIERLSSRLSRTFKMSLVTIAASVALVSSMPQASSEYVSAIAKTGYILGGATMAFGALIISDNARRNKLKNSIGTYQQNLSEPMNT